MNLFNYVREQKRQFEQEWKHREKALAELALCQQWYDGHQPRRE